MATTIAGIHDLNFYLGYCPKRNAAETPPSIGKGRLTAAIRAKIKLILAPLGAPPEVVTMELAEYLAAYQDYWSENLSKLLAIKASETVTVDAALLRFIADLDEPTYLLVLSRLKRLLELASPQEPGLLRDWAGDGDTPPGADAAGVADAVLPDLLAA